MAQKSAQGADLVLQLAYALLALHLLGIQLLEKLLHFVLRCGVFCEERIALHLHSLILILCELRVYSLILVGKLQLVVCQLQLLVLGTHAVDLALE